MLETLATLWIVLQALGFCAGFCGMAGRTTGRHPFVWALMVALFVVELLIIIAVL